MTIPLSDLASRATGGQPLPASWGVSVEVLRLRHEQARRKMQGYFLPLEECGGPGSGVPGPCPGGGKERQRKDEQIRKSRDRPVRPEGGFRDHAHVVEHAKKMVEAHENDRYVRSLHAKVQSAQRSFSQAQDKLVRARTNQERGTAKGQATRAANQLRQAREDLRSEQERTLQKSFGTRPEEQPKFTARNDDDEHTANRQAQWDQASALIASVSTQDAIGDHTVGLGHDAGGRSMYRPSEEKIYIAPGTGGTDAAHEFGHHLEHNSDRANAAVAAFAQRRFGDEQPTKLADISPHGGYRDDEYGRKDDMGKLTGSTGSAYYIGKIYESGGTEILSTGLEHLYKDPIHLARADPDYFATVMGVLQGSGQ